MTGRPKKRLDRLLGGTPSLALYVSASLLGSARAEDGARAPVMQNVKNPPSPAAQQSRRSQSLVAPNLLLPISVLDAHDSRLLRELLLVQGVEFDLGQRGISDSASFFELLQAMGADDVLNATLDMESLSRHATDGTLSIHSAVIYPEESADPTERISGISADWQILWLDQDKGVTSSTDFQKPIPATEEFTSGVTTGWNVDLVITRPATPDELTMLEAHGGDTGAGFATVLAPRPSSETASALNGNAAEQSVDVDLSSAMTSATSGASSLTVPVTAPGTGVDTAVADPGIIAAGSVSGLNVESDENVAVDSAASAEGENSEPELDSNIAVGALPAVPGMAPPINGTPSVSNNGESDDSRNTTNPAPNGLFSISEDVPEGFELLAGPQSLVVDIVFNGEKVGATAITLTGDEIYVDEPAALLELLPGVLQPERLLEALSAPLPANPHKICYGLDEPAGCGQLEVDIAGVIFDESKLSMAVFVASDFQTKRNSQSTRYLPPPDRRNSSILSVQAVAADFQEEESSVDLSARALLGYGRGNISTEIDYNTRTERQRLHEFKLTHHFTDHELIAGTYAYHPGGGLRDIALLGASYATSLKTRVDLEHAFSTELVVYLQRRSVVQLVVDGRVYAGDSYAAGNQVLDTSYLPDGTYELEIRILDSQSGSRIERRIFTKSTQIPPRGETVYQVTAGVPLTFSDNHIFPDTTDSSVAGLSFARRLTDQSAYRLGLVQFDSNSLLQAEYTYLGEYISFQFTGSAGGENTSASALRVGWQRDSTSLSFSSEHFTSDFNVDNDPVAEQFYSDDYQQVTFSLNRAYKTFSVGARWTYRESDGAEGNVESRQYALYYRRPLIRRKFLKGFFNASFQADEFDQQLNLQVKLFVDRGRWSTGLGSEVSFGENGDELRGSVDTTWRSSDKERYEWAVGMYANTNELGETAGAKLTLEHPWYQAGLSTDVNLNAASGSDKNTLAFASAHFGADARGVALGGADFAQAGVIIDIDGEPAGSRFDILVNDIKASTGEIGTQQFIGLRPYESYRIRFRPQTVLSNGLDQEDYEFTLFPGNVQRIEVVAEQKVLLIATLVDRYGELIENALVDHGPNPILIEAGGFFQAEVIPGEVLLVKPVSGAQCEFTVPEADGEEVVVVDEPILCREVESATE